MPEELHLNDRGRRRALNEAAFREINERLAALNETFAEYTNTFVIVCECDATGCAEQITVPRPQYEAVRSDPRRFVLVTGHQDPLVEDVVEDHGSYCIVEKRPGDPADVATATDPRAS